jgi:hypothetical protein
MKQVPVSTFSSPCERWVRSTYVPAETVTTVLLDSWYGRSGNCMYVCAFFFWMVLRPSVCQTFGRSTARSYQLDWFTNHKQTAAIILTLLSHAFEFFLFFFTFFFPLFCKNIWPAKKLQNYTSGAVGGGGRKNFDY